MFTEKFKDEKDFNEFSLAWKLIELIEESEDFDGTVNTYRDAGVMSNNAGLVVKDFDGNEFQITIVRSR